MNRKRNCKCACQPVRFVFCPDIWKLLKSLLLMHHEVCAFLPFFPIESNTDCSHTALSISSFHKAKPKTFSHIYGQTILPNTLHDRLLTGVTHVMKRGVVGFMLLVAHRPACRILQTMSHWTTVGLEQPPCLKAVPTTHTNTHTHQLQLKLSLWITRSALTAYITGFSYPKLVLSTPVEVPDGAGELVAIVAWLEAISLRRRQMTKGKTIKPGEQSLTRQPLWHRKQSVLMERNSYRTSSFFFLCFPWQALCQRDVCLRQCRQWWHQLYIYKCRVNFRINCSSVTESKKWIWCYLNSIYRKEKDYRHLLASNITILFMPFKRWVNSFINKNLAGPSVCINHFSK